MYLLLKSAQEPQILYPQPYNTQILMQALPFSCPQNIRVRQQLLTNLSSSQRPDDQKRKQYDSHSFSFPTKDGTNCFGISTKFNRFSNGYAIETYLFLVFSCPIEKYFQNYIQFKIEQMEQTSLQLINLTKQIWMQLSNLNIPLQFQYNEYCMTISQIRNENYEVKIQDPLPQMQQLRVKGSDMSEIISSLLSEQKVIVTGESREEISNFIEQTLLILNPLSYPGIYYYLLPEKYLHLIQVPFQVFCGIEMVSLRKAIIQPETLVYNLTEQKFMNTQRLEDQQIDIRYVIPRQILQQKNFKINLIYQQESKPDILLLNTNNFYKTDNFIPENIDAYNQFSVKKLFNRTQQSQKILVDKLNQVDDEHLKYRQVEYMHLLCPSYYNDQYFIKMIQFNERIYYSLTSGFLNPENSSKQLNNKKILKGNKNFKFSFDMSSKMGLDTGCSDTETPIKYGSKIKQLKQLYFGFKGHNEDDGVIAQLPQQIKDVIAPIFDSSEQTDIIPHPYSVILYYLYDLYQNKQEAKYNQELSRFQLSNIIGQPFLAYGAQPDDIHQEQLRIISEISNKFQDEIMKITLKISLQISLLQLVQTYRKYLRQQSISNKIQLQQKSLPTYECIMNTDIKSQHQKEIIRQLNMRIKQKIQQKKEQNSLQTYTNEQIDILMNQQKHKFYDKIIDTKQFILSSPPFLQSFLKHFTSSIWWESFLETQLCQEINEQQWIFNSYCKNNLQSYFYHSQRSPPSTNYINSTTPFSLTGINKQTHIKDISSSSTEKNDSIITYTETEDNNINCELQYISLYKQQQQDIISMYYQLFGPYLPLRIQQKDQNNVKLVLQCYKQTQDQNIWHKRQFVFTKTYEVVSVSWISDKSKEQSKELICSTGAKIELPEITKEMPTKYCAAICGRPPNETKMKKLLICFINKYDIYKFLQIMGTDSSNQLDRLKESPITEQMQNRRKARLAAIGAVQFGLEQIQDKDKDMQ